MPRRPELACHRCGNEEDLGPWQDGYWYCRPCMTCPHVHWCSSVADVCLTCVRELHTVVAPSGPRITDLETYVICARDEYDVDIHELRLWSYEEEGELQRHAMVLLMCPRVIQDRPAPPHHRLD